MAAAALLIPFKSAYALFIIDSIALKAVSGVILIINYFIAALGGMLMTCAGFLVDFAVNLNNSILPYGALTDGVNASNAVAIAWPIVRDLANLGFVLAIIFIAFYTILRIEGYETKQMLLKLVIAALLINFSLAIAGIFIDVSGNLTNFFLDKATHGNLLDLSSALANSFNIQKFLIPKTGFIGLGFEDLGTTIMIAISMVFITIFTLLCAVVLVALACMFFIRYVMLSFLVIVMPLVWLAWVWPDFKNLWSKWWDKFLKWTFFAPAASFFIYLALSISTANQHGGGPISAFSISDDVLASANLTINDMGSLIGQMVLVIGILVGGIIAAQEFGITGADLTMKGMKWAGNSAAGYVGNKMGRGILDRARNFGYKPETKDAAGNVKPGGSLLQRASAKFAGTPVIGGLARTTSSWASTTNKENVEQYEKDLDGLSMNKEAFLNYADSPAMKNKLMQNPAMAAAYINKAADKGFINDLQKKTSPEVFSNMVNASKSAGTAGKIYAKKPTLAALGLTGAAAKKATQDAVAKVKPADIVNLLPDDFTVDVLLSLSNQQIKQLSLNATTKQIELINKGIMEIQAKVKAGEKVFENDSERKKFANLEHWEESPAMNRSGGGRAQTWEPSNKIKGFGG